MSLSLPGQLLPSEQLPALTWWWEIRVSEHVSPPSKHIEISTGSFSKHQFNWKEWFGMVAMTGTVAGQWETSVGTSLCFSGLMSLRWQRLSTLSERVPAQRLQPLTRLTIYVPLYSHGTFPPYSAMFQYDHESLHQQYEIRCLSLFWLP